MKNAHATLTNTKSHEKISDLPCFVRSTAVGFFLLFFRGGFWIPPNYNLPQRGGVKVVSGGPFSHAKILDYDGNEGTRKYNEDSTCYCIYDWLRIEYQEFSSGDASAANMEITLFAEPNASGKTRKLYVNLVRRNEYQEITVKQNK